MMFQDLALSADLMNHQLYAVSEEEKKEPCDVVVFMLT